MQNVFRYFLLLGVYMIPIYFIMDDAEKFPILLFGFVGITIAYWPALYFIKRRRTKDEGQKKNEK